MHAAEWYVWLGINGRNECMNKRKINRAYLYADILIAKNPLGKKANKLMLLICYRMK